MSGYGPNILAVLDDDSWRSSPAQALGHDFGSCLIFGDQSVSSTWTFLINVMPVSVKTERPPGWERSLSMDPIRSQGPAGMTTFNVVQGHQVMFSSLFCSPARTSIDLES